MQNANKPGLPPLFIACDANHPTMLGVSFTVGDGGEEHTACAFYAPHIRNLEWKWDGFKMIATGSPLPDDLVTVLTGAGVELKKSGDSYHSVKPLKITGYYRNANGLR